MSDPKGGVSPRRGIKTSQAADMMHTSLSVAYRPQVYIASYCLGRSVGRKTQGCHWGSTGRLAGCLPIELKLYYTKID